MDPTSLALLLTLLACFNIGDTSAGMACVLGACMGCVLGTPQQVWGVYWGHLSRYGVCIGDTSAGMGCVLGTPQQVWRVYGVQWYRLRE